MIYLDNNATTQIDPTVRDAMLPFLESAYANPSSPYMAGRAASRAITESRERCAAVLGAPAPSILFTSGGTESNNTVFHAARELHPDRNEIIISSVEHSSIINYGAYLRRKGFLVHEVPADVNGRLDLSFFSDRLSDRTALVSIMMANNETGVLSDLDSFVHPAKSAGALFHTDAVQAYGKVPIDALEREADFISFSAHKIHGPKGCGGLYVREGLKMPPYIIGGDQEHGRRGGTENVAGIAGLGQAARLALDGPASMTSDVEPLRDQLEGRLLDLVADTHVAGRKGPRLPNTTMIILQHIDVEALIDVLDMENICCSSGSACMSGSTEPSHVLKGMGYPDEMASSGIRLSLSKFSSQNDVECVIGLFPRLVKRLRSLDE